MIRKLDKTEYALATSLALEVYIQCGAEDFDEEGLNSFKSFISNEQLMNELVIYGAFEDKNLVGIMGTKNEGKHLSLFFIRNEYHRKGIGRQLFNFAINHCPVNEMTVNSSTYAIPFYQSLGFDKIAGKQCTNGITYTPMKFTMSCLKE
ncbi:GNAT family N-acetyltransferase [Bacteroides xylanisolvens]|uniref:GNAT family N-acetyltransferase n=1 Tax=Bacteroides xylanisolvens TaxID=371601 RepID=A0A1Y4VP54_9BACE|nr:GNAT family N-acetyltransferase [Bacteroides xylanisolvens]KAA9050586.1 GNAT family N-acetyltransferase [Bacteroides xylanisolvens]MBX9092920.1 GNAT family N-acetyltransferase [Bacteroides xylanisolvens]MBX9166982.1 GNAT family N-acetyltransferase [Bacteroides xylanisolvens]MCA4534146.1 GNAT family N-acetyltransferase [Bacteroides xylanisolvens]MCA4552178.1 GNAT family N-acetyltransferase [Bacteroides xylanisolvens]